MGVSPALAGSPQHVSSSAPRGFRAWFDRLREAPARSRRIGLLLVAVLLISLADLDMTLAYATSGGMLEANPIARAVMSYGSSRILTVWKLLSVGVCVWILFRTRRRFSAEVATWACFAALVWLSFRWVTYNEQMPVIATQVMVDGDHLVPPLDPDR
jgi:hypothetical protein